MSSPIVSLADCQRRSGITRSTLYRWIAAGRLKKKQCGGVSMDAVEKLKARQRRGRPHALSALERLYLVRDTTALAAPYLSATHGLARFAAVAAHVLAHHAAQPVRRKQCAELLADMAAALGQTG